VLIVDDSALARQALQRVLSAQDDIEVVGCATDPFHAARLIRDVVPDVIVLDVEMPRMDGITFLRKLMQQHPIPTVICSSLAQANSPTAMAALEAGAVDLIQKPTLATREFYELERVRIGDVVRAASKARVGVRKYRPAAKEARLPRLSELRMTDKVFAVGASTGGTEAVRVLLEGFGPESPATAIVQHMPAGFTAGFARRLNQIGRVLVKEAQDNDPLLAGQVLIAPGDRHMAIRRSGARYFVSLLDTPPVNRHRPSVDVLFHSAAECVGRNAVGLILTGMGDDGARGLLRMREAGGYTLAQDEESCIVFGMPREAVRLGAASQQLPLEALAAAAHEAVRFDAPTMRPPTLPNQSTVR
jgi:two-component system chemotaxis response regulator CheB